jgi:hypothetical protein
MDEQTFYIRDAAELNLPHGDVDLRWLVYGSIKEGLSDFICACSGVDAANRVVEALECMQHRSGYHQP